MKFNHPIFILLILVTFGCSSSQNNSQLNKESLGAGTQGEDSVTPKEEGIQVFKKEMGALRDSAIYYFEMGFQALEEGQDRGEVSGIIKPKLTYFADQIDKKSQAFYDTAIELELTEKEYEQVFDELKITMQPMLEKFKKLRDLGIEI